MSEEAIEMSEKAIEMSEKAIEMSEKAIEMFEDKAIEMSEDKAIEMSEDKAIEMSEDKAIEMSEDKAIEMSEDKALEMSEDKVIEMSEEKAIEMSEEKTTEMSDVLEMPEILQKSEEKALEMSDKKALDISEINGMSDVLEMSEENALEKSEVIELEMPEVIELERSEVIELEMPEVIDLEMSEETVDGLNDCLEKDVKALLGKLWISSHSLPSQDFNLPFELQNKISILQLSVQDPIEEPPRPLSMSPKKDEYLIPVEEISLQMITKTNDHQSVVLADTFRQQTTGKTKEVTQKIIMPEKGDLPQTIQKHIPLISCHTSNLLFEEVSILKQSLPFPVDTVTDNVLEKQTIIGTESVTYIPEKPNTFLDKKSLGNKVVWAKLKNYSWWPAFVITNVDCGCSLAKPGNTWVFWLGEYKVSEVPQNKIQSFVEAFPQNYSSCKLKIFTHGVKEALQILAEQAGCETMDFPGLVQWATEGFKTSSPLSEFCLLPDFVVSRLEKIKIAIKDNTNPSDDDSCSREQIGKKCKELIFNRIKDRLLKITDICIVCSGEKQNLIPHPLFEGGFCNECTERFRETIFAQGEDGKNICCIICNEEGYLILCDRLDCSRSYCCNCIELFICKEAVTKITNTSPWHCFFCSSLETGNGLLRVKTDWKQNLLHFFHNPNRELEIPIIYDHKDKKPLKVLSLFDGIGTGMYVLDLLGIDIDKYYACEIDDDAVNIARFHYGTTIVQLGDVTKITQSTIKKLCPIDLLIGGSPCNDISLVNPAKKGLFDLTGTGQLFFYYYQLLESVRFFNRGKQVFWFFENVAAMCKREKDIISQFLMCDPVMIDAKFFSPQARPRYYWGNLPGMYGSDSYWKSLKNPTTSEGINETLLDKFVLHKLNRKAVVSKIGTVTTQSNSLLQGYNDIKPVTMNGENDTLWLTELETIFGFPRHYTDVGNISLTKRRELLGKCWSTDVIKHLLKPLAFFFQSRK